MLPPMLLVVVPFGMSKRYIVIKFNSGAKRSRMMLTLDRRLRMEDCFKNSWYTADFLYKRINYGDRVGSD